MPTRAVAALLLSVPLLLLPAVPSAAEAGGDGVVEVPVTFTVQNTNRTDIECDTDGDTYDVRGHLIAPEGALETADTATLFLHGLGYGEFFYNFDEVDGYNFAQKQAEAGHVSVVVDRLGYESSDKPNGYDICFGSHADVAHQIVEQIRSGDYASEGHDSSSFDQVVLAGHSVGGLIVQAEAYSFGDIDGLIVLSYSDEVVSPAAMTALETAVAKCRDEDTMKTEDGEATGYVPLTDRAGFVMSNFFTANADADVVDATADSTTIDPCGDYLSIMDAVELNLENVSEIDVPTLVVIGEEDGVFPTPASTQAALFTGTDDVTAVTLPRTSHAITLHNSADEFSATVSDWLTDHDFGGPADMPVGGVDAGFGGTAAGGDQEEGTGTDAPQLMALSGGVLVLVGAGLLAARRRQPVS